MNLQIERKIFLPDRTLGGLYTNDHWGYWVLEDTDRHLETGGIKIPKLTAIPRGKYKVTISWSNRFRRLMPHILDIPQFTGVRIHIGNYPGDTDGCPIIGMERDIQTNDLHKSKLAFDDFFPKLEKWLIEGEVWLEII